MAAILEVLQLHAEHGEVACLEGQSKKQRVERVSAGRSTRPSLVKAKANRLYLRLVDAYKARRVDRCFRRWRAPDKSKVKPRAALREIERALEGQKPIVSSQCRTATCASASARRRLTWPVAHACQG